MSKPTTIWILGDQLNPRISALEGVAPSEFVVLMIDMYDKLDRGQVRAIREQAAQIREKLRQGQP
jgi:hypothetical protein